MKRQLLCLSVLFALVFTMTIHADERPQTTKAAAKTSQNPNESPEDGKPPEDGESTENDGPSVWMRLKLQGSQDLLAALVRADFDGIRQSATRLNSFGRFERFVRGKNEEYNTQLRFFRNANQQIIRQADRKNVEGAALGFMQLTASCVNCHKVIRDSAGKIFLEEEETEQNGGNSDK
jgi:hypothetical protein